VDASPARFRTFDAIRQFFHQASQQVPIIVVLDNLHWTDASSLALLEFLSQELLRSRLLILGTYRDFDASNRAPLLSILGGLSGDPDVQRIHLSGLSRFAIGQVAEKLCGVTLSDPVLQAIFQRTEGNPLFAIELIKVLIDEKATGAATAPPAKIPAGIRETIGRRLIRLDERCRELLGVAAIHGRQFTVRELAATLDLNLRHVLTELEPAVQAGIIQTNGDSFGSYQFTHALIRETIYEGMPVAQRMRSHGHAADALLAVHAAHLEPVLARVAHHYHEAAPLDGNDKAVAYAFRAAESAARIYAYEEALVHYDRAISMLESAAEIQDERLARANFLKGLALKQLGRVQASIEALLTAVNRSRLLGSVELLVDILTLLALISRHVEQHHFVPLLKRALTVMPKGDSETRAKALATLAFAKRSCGDRLPIGALVDEALDVARRSCDAVALCACYQLAIMALRGDPKSLPKRLQLGQEFIAVARTTGNPDLLAESYHWQALNYIEAGHMEELESLLGDYEGLSTTRFGLHQYQCTAYRVTLALLRGEWTDLEPKIEALLEIGTKTRREDADGVYGAQMFALNRDLGRLPSLAPEIRMIVSTAPKRMWEPGLMLVCAEIGLLAEARAIFDRLVADDCRALGRDDMFVACLVFCAETCCVLADAEKARCLLRLLMPYCGQTANHPTAVCFGVTDLYLGMLSRIANQPQAAADHFERALELNRAIRAWPILARTSFHYGAFLLTQQPDEARRLGRQHLREAEQLARRLGLAQLIVEVDALLHTKDAGLSFPDDLTAREVEVLRLLSIGRTNKDVSLVLAISLNTVATHVRNLLNKTRCANRTEAAVYAIAHGLHTPLLESVIP
jgi:DNA-binding CsgD family transcriptional regulator